MLRCIVRPYVPANKFLRVFVFDFNKESGINFELYNPTFSEGVSTGDVILADAMEFDITGQYVVYDAQNEIQGNNGSLQYWDIGFLHVWNRGNDNFSNGEVSKLFSALPEGVSVGNPTFSKNSPSIIAFDLLEGNDNKILGANLEQSVTNEMVFNNGLGWPNYSKDDDQLIYNFPNGGYLDIGRVTLNSDKISSVVNSDEYFILDADWGVWYSNGDRDLYVDNKDLEEPGAQVHIFPNPVAETMRIELESNRYSSYSILDAMGRSVMSGNISDNDIDVRNIAAGKYFLRLQGQDATLVKFFVKI